MTDRLALRAAAVCAGHRGVRVRLVREYQFLCGHIGDLIRPRIAGGHHVGTVPLGDVRRLFFA